MRGRPQYLRNPILRNIVFEWDEYNELKEDCDNQGVSISEGVRALIHRYHEEKAIADNNSCNIPYANTTPSLKSSSIDNGNGKDKHLQTLEEWVRRDNAVRLIKDVDATMVEHVGINMIIAARFKKTGIYRDVKVI